MFDNDRSIHLINPLDKPAGSEWRTLSLFKELKDHCAVSLWSEYTPHPLFLEEFPIKKIFPRLLKFPKKGTFVFVGFYYNIGRWIYFTRPKRIILVCNGPSLKRFLKRLHFLSIRGFPKVEIVYPSNLQKNLAGYPGAVEYSLIDIDKFRPSDISVPVDTHISFTIGRLSRDVKEKHHTDDPALYLRLVNHGCRVRIMGGTCLETVLKCDESVTLMPEGAYEARTFLQGLDCFYYRTSDKWLEPYGRVVAEAMACGLPVVCHNRGGFTELIDHGRNGFLFNTNEEACNILLRLKEDSVLRKTIGIAARQTIEEIYSPSRRAEIINFYLRK